MAIKKEIEIIVDSADAKKAVDDLVKSNTNLTASFEDVYGELKPLSARMGELEDRMYELALAGKTNTQEYKDLQNEVAKYKRTIIETDIAVDSLATTTGGKMSGALNAAASGFQVYEAGLGLIGVESEAVQESLLKVQSAMALADGIAQIQREGIPAIKSLFSALSSTAIGQKLLTAAQIAGAAAMRVLNIVMAANPILLIVSGVTALVGAFYLLTRSTNEQAEAEKELNRQHELSIKLMKIQQEDADKYLKSIQKNSANKIALRKAEGANDEEIYQLEKKRLEDQINYVKTLHEFGVKLTAEQYANQKQAKYDLKILEAQHETDLRNIREKAQEEANKKAEERRKKKIEDDKLEAERQRQKALDEQAADQASYDYFAEQDRKKAEAKELARIQEMEDAQMLANFQEEIRLKEIRDEEEKQAKLKQLRANQVQGIQDTLSIISNLTELFAGKSRKQQERAFKIQKAVNIASAVVDTYKAANAALASSPPPFNFIAMGAAITAGLLNVKKIASTKFDGGSTPSASGGGGSFGSGSIGGSMEKNGGVIAPNFNIVGAGGVNQLGSLAPVQAYVVSSEMTTQQALDRNRMRNATF